MIVPMNPQTDMCLESKESSNIPQWSAAMPTRELIKRGLTFNALQTEVQELNALSIKNTKWVPSIWIGVVLFWFGMISMFVIIISSGHLGQMWIPIWIAGMCCFIIGSLMTYYHWSTIEKGFGATREQIESNLNAKYEPKGIFWTVADGIRIRRSMAGSNNVYQPVHHIVISCINTDNAV